MAVASAATAIAVLAAPWWGTFPPVSAFPVWLKLIADPILGGRLLGASSPNPAAWMVAIPGATLCVLVVTALARLLGERWTTVAIGAVAVGLAATVVGGALAQPCGSAASASGLLIAGCSVFGVGVALIGLRLTIIKDGRPNLALRWSGILLLSAGGSLASFVLFPLGLLLLGLAFALGATALGRECARARALP